jgi:hypothetical protein
MVHGEKAVRSGAAVTLRALMRPLLSTRARTDCRGSAAFDELADR